MAFIVDEMSKRSYRSLEYGLQLFNNSFRPYDDYTDLLKSFIRPIYFGLMLLSNALLVLSLPSRILDDLYELDLSCVAQDLFFVPPLLLHTVILDLINLSLAGISMATRFFATTFNLGFGINERVIAEEREYNYAQCD